MADVRRTRSITNPDKKAKVRTKKFSYPGGSLISDVVTDADALGPTETITDIRHSNYEKRRKAGELIFGDLALARSKKTAGGGQLNFVDVNIAYELSGALFSAFRNGSNPPPVVNRNSAIASTKAIAAISALKKLNEAEVDFGEVLGTLAQTVKMLSSPFSGMQQLLHRMDKSRLRKFRKRKGGPPSAGDWASATADTWLEQSFGWRPLVGDTLSCMGMYAEKARQAEEKWRFARGGSKQTSSTFASSTGYQGSGTYVNLKAVVNWERRFTYRSGAGVVYTVPMGFENGFYSRHLGLGVNNLAQSAWNLTPYSWVADQVVGIGDWIQAATPSPGLLILQKWMTGVRTEEIIGSSKLEIKRAPKGGSLTTYSGSGGSYTDEVLEIQRVLTFDLPSSPQFNPYLGNLAQALNNVAFGAQIVRGLLNRWVH